MAAVRIGTSGWSYDHWRDHLYPPGTSPAGRLDAYTAAFDTVELNSSFYHWPRVAAFRSWARRLPDGFLMTVKAPRGLTHAGVGLDPARWTARLAEGMSGLGPFAGPLLLQLPPSRERDDAWLERLLGAVPGARVAAVELRHPSWVHDDVFAMLEAHGATYCVMSGAGLACELRATARLVYVRFHGPDREHLYAGGYSDADLDWWAARIGEWRAGGHDVLAYFNNDGEGHAVYDARRLRERVG
ncbi:DUF72 domain-containing protein [Microbacterium sp.]|uniref:DUF72 domain-containing protein n=1 Tax=Microbacterium sp. TaxID=51671 RepID=UPI003C716601